VSGYRVDRTRSRGIGIACGISAVSLVFPFVLWGVIGVVAVIGAVGFLANAKWT
jgi:hypothetical protein